LPHLRSERGEPLDAWRPGPARAAEFEEVARPPSGKLKPGPGRPAAEVADHQQGRIRDALLEIVAERGYAGVTIRELARRAGVSTRSVYQHYPNKESCFLGIHQIVVHRLLRVMETEAAHGAGDVDRCLRCVVTAMVREWSSDPRAAHLMLIDAYAASPFALKQACLASRAIEARIGECLDDTPDKGSLAPLVAEGIVAGVFSAVRARLLEGGDLDELCDPLGRWAGAYCELPEEQIAKAGLAQPAATSAGASASWGEGEEPLGLEGDRGLLLAATAKLVASRGTASLELDEIVSTAGISRRGFEAQFADLEACLAAAHQLYADRVVDHLARAEEKGPVDACSRLAGQLAVDPTLATLCFSDVATSGPRLIRDHHRFLARVAGMAAGNYETAGLAAEASAGALWGLLRQRVVMGRVAQASESALALASLALHPLQSGASRLFAP
jgi:AcrR family transcriptional regulator